LVAALGVGIGLLAAPEAGAKTRKRLRRKLAALGEDLGEGLEEVQELGGRARELGGRARELSGRARDRMRERLASIRRREAELDAVEDDEDEGEESGALGTVLAMAAGAAATYFLASERAAPARTRVRETAETVRRKASDRWERYQQSRANGYADETAEGDAPSDDTPRGS
jgi:gas vesicle protein